MVVGFTSVRSVRQMSGSAPCFCCPEAGAGTAALDRALDELGMLATVSPGRRQHQAESRRRRRRYTISALQRRPPPAAAAPTSPSASAQIAEQMSRIRLDAAPGAEALTQQERAAFETLYINWDYVSSVGAGPLRTTPAAKTRRSLPYDSERCRERAGGRARTSSWSQQEQEPATGDGGAAARPPGDAEPAPPHGDAGGSGAGLVRSLSMENLKLGERRGDAVVAAAGADVDTIRQGMGELSVQFR